MQQNYRIVTKTQEILRKTQCFSNSELEIIAGKRQKKEPVNINFTRGLSRNVNYIYLKSMKINTLILRNFWLVNWSNLFVNATKILVGLWQSWLLFAWGFLLLKLRILFGDLLPGDPVTGKLFDHGGDVIQGHSNLEGGVSLAESGREGFLKGSKNQDHI